MDIASPIDKVFALLCDKDKLPLWLDGLEETRYADDYDPAHPLGARFIQRIREGGRVQEYDGEVTAHAPPNHLGIRLKAKAFTVDVDYRLTSIEPGTRLDYSARVNCNGWFMRIMGFLMGGFARLILRKQLRKLKALAEQGA
jgi:hypothetical protein